MNCRVDFPPPVSVGCGWRIVQITAFHFENRAQLLEYSPYYEGGRMSRPTGKPLLSLHAIGSVDVLKYRGSEFASLDWQALSNSLALL